MSKNQIVPQGKDKDDLESLSQPKWKKQTDNVTPTVPMTKPKEKPATKRLESNAGGIDLTKVEYKKFNTEIRSTKAARFCHKIISTTAYRIASCLSVIIALFLTDFTRALMTKDVDYAVEIIMVIVFLFLLSDLILQSITYPNYPFSFFFWLDFVGTLTLLADMDIALSLVGSSYSELTVARGGRAGRAARTAGSLRLSKIVMWARVARLMKIARIFRFLKDENQQKSHSFDEDLSKNNSHDIDMDHDEILDADFDGDLERNSSMKHHQSRADRNSQISMGDNSSGKSNSNIQTTKDKMYRQQHSSKIGMTVADSITRDVVFGILLTVSLTPIFNSATEETYSAMYLAADWFDFYVDNASTMNIQDYVNVFLNEHSDIKQLQINGTYYMNEASVIDGLRDSEMMVFSGTHTSMILDIQSDTQFGHGMNIGFTLVIVCLFAGLAFLITTSIGKLVVHPIEKMTRIIQEFTKKVCFLGGDMEDQASIVSNLLETQVIEAAIGTLSNIFDAIAGAAPGADKDNDDKSGGSGKQEVVSGHGLPKTEGVTYIKSRDSVISINIKETKRVFISEEEIQQKIQELDDSADIDSFCVSVERFPELQTVASAMEHPIASEYFRSYCTAHMAGENFSFVRAVWKYHESLKKEFMTIFNGYISDDAKEQIPVDGRKKKILLKLYDDNKFSIDCFDDVRDEVVQSLQSQIFQSFCKSKWVSAYVCSMENVKDRYKHLNLHKFDKHKPSKSANVSPNSSKNLNISDIIEEDENENEDEENDNTETTKSVSLK